MALMDLAKAKMALAESMKRIEELRNAKDKMIHELEVLESAGLAVKKHRMYIDYRRGLENDIKNEKKRIAEIKKEIKIRHDAVELQRIKKETLEAMRRDAFNKHIKDSLRAEQKVADEMANLRKRIGLGG